MTNQQNNTEEHQQVVSQIPQGYFIPMPISEPDDRISILELWSVLFKFKRLVVAIIILCVTISALTSFIVTPVYRAEVLLAPATSDNNSNGGITAFANQFGGLANLAGISVGGGGDVETAIATLKSRKFITRFIADLELKPILFAKQWDSNKKKWMPSDLSFFNKVKKAFDSQSDTILRPGMVSGEPSDGMAYKKFYENMLSVSQDKKSQLITVSVEWKTAQQAAEWANALIYRLNEELRQNTIDEAERSIAYLTEQISLTSLSELQNIMYRLIEEHTKIITLAKVNDEYVMKVIDPAVPPEVRSKPKRKLMLILGGVLGLVLGVFSAFFINTIRDWRHQERQKDVSN